MKYFSRFFINVHFRYILVHHGFGLVIKGSSNLNFFNILYWLLNTFLVLFIFLSMPLAKVHLNTNELDYETQVVTRIPDRGRFSREHPDGSDMYVGGDSLAEFRGHHHQGQDCGLHLPHGLLSLLALLLLQSAGLRQVSVSL